MIEPPLPTATPREPERPTEPDDEPFEAAQFRRSATLHHALLSLCILWLAVDLCFQTDQSVRADDWMSECIAATLLALRIAAHQSPSRHQERARLVVTAFFVIASVTPFELLAYHGTKPTPAAWLVQFVGALVFPIAFALLSITFALGRWTFALSLVAVSLEVGAVYAITPLPLGSAATDVDAAAVHAVFWVSLFMVVALAGIIFYALDRQLREEHRKRAEIRGIAEARARCAQPLITLTSTTWMPASRLACVCACDTDRTPAPPLVRSRAATRPPSRTTLAHPSRH